MNRTIFIANSILEGGGDWAVMRADGIFEVDIRAVIETDDGERFDVGLDDITKAVTVFDWGPGPKPGAKNSKKRGDQPSPEDPERRAAV